LERDADVTEDDSNATEIEALPAEHAKASEEGVRQPHLKTACKLGKEP